MKKHNEQFEKNISRLVKSTRESQIPSESFTNNLIDEALKELPKDQSRRQKRNITMKSVLQNLFKVTACVLVIAGIFSLFKTGFFNQTQESTKPKEKMLFTKMNNHHNDQVAIPLVLPKPMFVGTPENLAGMENLEKPLGKPRPPFYAPAGTKNVALNKSVTSSEPEPIMGTLDMIVDGDKEATEGSVIELGPFDQWIVIDLEDEYDIYAIVFWHFHKTARVYFDVAVQVSSDPKFITDVTTLFNNDHDNSLALGVGTDLYYVETFEGRLIDARGVKGRYVRLYSQANNQNDYSHYIEVEVYGKPTDDANEQDTSGPTVKKNSSQYR